MSSRSPVDDCISLLFLVFNGVGYERVELLVMRVT